MFFWVLYFLGSFVISFFTSSLVSRKRRVYFFIISLVILVTPSYVQLGSEIFAPGIFIFFFNLILENQFSTQPLRPLIFSVPVAIIFIFTFFRIKRKFS